MEKHLSKTNNNRSTQKNFCLKVIVKNTVLNLNQADQWQI